MRSPDITTNAALDPNGQSSQTIIRRQVIRLHTNRHAGGSFQGVRLVIIAFRSFESLAASAAW